MRVLLFTDTLFDINGVSRFILNIAEQSHRRADPSRQLHVATSTRVPPPPGLGPAASLAAPGDHQRIHNTDPRFAARMPGYPNLEIVLPPRRRLAALARRLRPDVIHVSTPGPVGLAGRALARRLNVPLLGTYHTDFPAYIDHLFDDRALTWLTDLAMRRFYAPFARIFTRSADYAAALARLNIPPASITRLLPGIDTDTFHIKHRPADPRAFWSTYPGVDPDAVKVLYVGRISVEKNLPMLTSIWRSLAPRLATTTATTKAQLIIIGDGPYRRRMQAELAKTPTAFLGFRHGPELSALYAAADIFAFPSTTDTLGQVVMEAQSAGLPVLVTDKGGPSEVVNSTDSANRTGYVLPADDTQSWTTTLLRLITTPPLRAQLGAAAHRAIQPMSIRNSFDHFWSVHEQAAASNRTPIRAATVRERLAPVRAHPNPTLPHPR